MMLNSPVALRVAERSKQVSLCESPISVSSLNAGQGGLRLTDSFLPSVAPGAFPKSRAAFEKRDAR